MKVEQDKEISIIENTCQGLRLLLLMNDKEMQRFKNRTDRDCSYEIAHLEKNDSIFKQCLSFQERMIDIFTHFIVNEDDMETMRIHLGRVPYPKKIQFVKGLDLIHEIEVEQPTGREASGIKNNGNV